MGLSKGFDSGKNGKKSRIEDGLYPARIQSIIDLGIQHGEYEGQERVAHEVNINFEFPTERIDVDGNSRPKWLGRSYTVSMHEKSALYKLVKAADPNNAYTNKGRNVKGLLGLPVMVEVGSTSTGNAKIKSVTRVMKGIDVGELENDAIFFDLDAPDVKVFAKFPDWLKDKIKAGDDFDDSWLYETESKKEGAKKNGKEEDDDTPF